MPEDGIRVKTHVARDFLQSAQLFKTEKLAVWEYVSNSLQYVDPGVAPVVRVLIDSRSKRITVQDNGRGMERQGLQNFFLMHGENLDRKAGQRGRGRFGTGKSAAFGIADCLRVRTVRNGLRNVVELRRADVERGGASGVPVRTVEREVATDEPNGTTVEISEMRIKKLDRRGVVAYIERHLARWPGKPTVIVNGTECEYCEPAVVWSETLEPSAEERRFLGNVQLTLKVSASPLPTELQGVAVYANGVWLESTLAGAEGQAMAQYIFGDIDVPLLDDDSVPIAAFDMSRSMELNRSNDVVRVLLGFLGREVDRIRRRLAREERSRRAEEEMRKLAREAERIAEILNEDFQDFSDRVARTKARSGAGVDVGPSAPSGERGQCDTLVSGSEIQAEPFLDSGALGHGDGAGGNGREVPNAAPVLRSSDHGNLRGDAVRDQGNRRRPRGAFHVEFRPMGTRGDRAYYESVNRTILINLEHPQISAARGASSTEDPTFRRLAYEVAFSTYAVALARELCIQGEYLEPTEAVDAINETLNRLALRAASLYVP